MRSFTALINPISGGGHAHEVLAPIARALRAKGATITIAETTSREHAIELAAKAAGQGDVVVAVGGDGLARDAAGGVVPTGGTLAIVPAGRGNDLARKLGLPAGPAELARLLLDEPARAIDVLDANGVIVPGNVYVGIDSVSTAIINGNRWMPGRLLYRLAPAFALLRWKPVGYTLQVDGEEHTVQANTVVIANSGTYGHGLRIVPDAVVDDGLLDVLSVGEGPRNAIVKFMGEAKTGAHVHRAEVSVRTAREITLHTDRPVPLCADGDEIGTLPVTVRVRPGALNIIAARS